jgi:hypothetical protein
MNKMLPPEVIETFPEEIRDNPSWEKFNDVGSIAKSYIEVQKLNGDSIRLPAKDAKPEDSQKWWNDTHNKLADRGFVEKVPSKPEEYELPEIEGFKPDPELVDSFVKEVAMEAKLTPSQFRAVVAFQHKMNQEMGKNLMTPEAADAEFKNMLGNDYSSVMESVQTASQAMSEDFPQFAEWNKHAYVVTVEPDGRPGKAYPFAAHPMVRGMMELMGNMSKEDNAGGGSPPNGNRGKESIQAEIDEIMQTPKFKQGDQATVDRVDNLRRQLWGTGEV